MSNPKKVTQKPDTAFDPSGLSTKKENKKLGKLYVWELPVRIFHWLNALAIVVLMITGIFIGKPFVSASIQEEASFSFLMGWVRYIHFFAAFVFSGNLLVRLYWVYKGNSYATSNPFKKIFWVEAWETVKYYLFLPNKKTHTIGHNTLAQFSYWVFIGLGSIVMMLTGYYMYFEPQFDSSFWGIGAFFSYVGILFGGDSFSVRSWHHIVSWGFMIFIVVHIYMSFREDWLSRNGTLSSIVTGYKTEKVHENQKKENHSEGDKSA